MGAWSGHLRRGRGFCMFNKLPPGLAIVLRANIGPSMRLFHVLFAIAFALTLIRTRMELAFVHGWSHGVLVVDVTVSFFLRRPTILRIFAGWLVALPGTRVGFLVLGQITRSLEFLVTVPASLSLLRFFCFSLLATSHGMEKFVIWPWTA